MQENNIKRLETIILVKFSQSIKKSIFFMAANKLLIYFFAFQLTIITQFNNDNCLIVNLKHKESSVGAGRGQDQDFKNTTPSKSLSEKTASKLGDLYFATDIVHVSKNAPVGKVMAQMINFEEMFSTFTLENQSEDDTQSTDIEEVKTTEIPFNCDVEHIPFLISIQKVSENHNQHICTGSLITTQHILTSATCCLKINLKEDNKTYYIVVAGVTSPGLDELTKPSEKPFLQSSEIEKLLLHEYYNDHSHDICVIKLERPLELNKMVDVALIPPNDGMNECSNGVVVNFRNDSKDYLLNCSKIVVLEDLDLCKNLSFIDLLHPATFCALGEDNSERYMYDSGSPLSCSGELYGILHTDEEASDSGRKTTFTKVSAFYEWIEFVVNNPEDIGD